MTAMSNFQGQQDGACLRASEVKPAFDRFIRAWLEKQGVNIVKDAGAWIYTSDENGKQQERHIAFRYRMTFRAKGDMPNGYTCNKGRYSLRDGKPNVKPDRENTHIHPLFFAAMGVDGFDVRPDTRVGEEVESRNKGVFYNDGMSMTILVPGAETVCIDDKNKSLADVMKELLPPFFALHCFGNRSNKGFGSFGVKSINDTDVDPLSPEALKSYAPLGTVYYAEYGQSVSPDDYLNDVFMLSSLIKGGLNYTHGNLNDKRYYKGMIIQSFLENHIKSEKAAIKSFVLNQQIITDLSAPSLDYRKTTITKNHIQDMILMLKLGLKRTMTRRKSSGLKTRFILSLTINIYCSFPRSFQKKCMIRPSN